MSKIEGLQHNSFYVRNQRKEKLSSLWGMSQGTDMDMYDYEFNPDGSLKKIIKIHHVRYAN